MRILMCPPLFFDIQEENSELNPWMNKSVQPDKGKALQQWVQLSEILKNLECEIHVIEAKPGLGDMCFAANAAWQWAGIFIMSNFPPSVWWRKDETHHYVHWLVSHRMSVYFLSDGISFEGQADIVTFPRSYLYGSSARNADPRCIIDHLARRFNFGHILPVSLIDPRFYHLDLALHYAKGIQSVLWCPDAFDRDNQRRIETHITEENLSHLELSVNEAIQEIGRNRRNFLLNSIGVGKTEVIPWNREHEQLPSKIRTFIESRGGMIQCVDVSEFGCSGGGARCLTLFMD